MTIGWAVARDPDCLDEAMFFGRKIDGKIRWYLSLSFHNILVWCSGKMCDLIVSRGLELAGREESVANKKSLSSVIERSILRYAYLGEHNSIDGFSLGSELRDLVKTYGVKVVASEKKIYQEDDGAVVLMDRDWDALGDSEVGRADKV